MFDISLAQGEETQFSRQSKPRPPQPKRDRNAIPNEDLHGSTARSQKSLTDTEISSKGNDRFFRSASQLRPQKGDALLENPWTVPGGLSVLTGNQYIISLPLWIVNLAAHAVAGRHFLDADPVSGDVVMLADTAPAHLRGLLQRVDFLQREDFERLHMIHRGDVRQLSWRAVLDCLYERAHKVDANLILVSDLGRFLCLKEGPEPASSKKVARALTVESPSDCAVVAAKMVAGARPDEPLPQTISRLGILGDCVDKILRIDDLSSTCCPRLRSLSAIGKADATPTIRYCVHHDGRFENVNYSTARDELRALKGALPSRQRVGRSEPDLFDG